MHYLSRDGVNECKKQHIGTVRFPVVPSVKSQDQADDLLLLLMFVMRTITSFLMMKLLRHSHSYHSSYNKYVMEIIKQDMSFFFYLMTQK